MPKAHSYNHVPLSLPAILAILVVVAPTTALGGSAVFQPLGFPHPDNNGPVCAVTA